jgi:thiamine-phosphate pyrophosphorylase
LHRSRSLAYTDPSGIVVETLAGARRRASARISRATLSFASLVPGCDRNRSSAMTVDLRLYALVDPEHAGGRELAELSRLVAQGGATLVQLRDKRSDTRPMVQLARAIKAALAPFRIPLLVNDRVDVALASGADGVHVGQQDMAVEDARRLLGPRAIIGLSIKTVAQAEAAPLDLLDYVGVGGVFATSSKDNPNPPIGPAGLARIAEVFRRRAPGFPLCGIAGIDAGNAGEAIAAGADGVAVISALSLQADPQAAAHALRGVVDVALARRQHR